MNFTNIQAAAIIRYKDENKTFWQDYKLFPPDLIEEAYQEYKTLDPNKYQLILRSEALIVKDTSKDDFIKKLKVDIEKLPRYHFDRCLGTYLKLDDVFAVIKGAS